MAGSIFKQVLGTAKSSVRSVTTKVKSGPTKIFTKIRKKIIDLTKKFFNMLTKKPSKKSDYVSIGKLFVSKRVCFFALLGLLLGLYLLVNMFIPWAEGKWWTVDLYIGSEKYSTFSGKVRVHDNDNRIVFEGDMNSGKAEGYGTQYSIKGELVYKGEYQDNVYSGKGEKYEEGVLVYKGDFSNGEYQGEGQLYNAEGTLVYSGSFENGEKSGKGTEYSESTGNKIYTGDFQGDQRSGEGKEYLENGKTLIYEGQFADGLYGGTGKKYKDGQLVYDGSFESGKYSGTGTAYDSNGSILYKGNFEEDLYNGEGTLYDTSKGVKLYVGNFENGKKEGEGTLYDILGTVKYSGPFKDDNIDYVSNLGKSESEIIEIFGKPSYNTVENSEKFLTYSSLGLCMVFGEDSSQSKDKNATDAEENYILKNIIMTLKDKPYGISENSTLEEVQSKLGKSTFSAGYFNVTETYKKAFGKLGLNDLAGASSVPATKYIMGDEASYFIRLFYATDKSKIEALEIAPTS